MKPLQHLIPNSSLPVLKPPHIAAKSIMNVLLYLIKIDVFFPLSIWNVDSSLELLATYICQFTTEVSDLIINGLFGLIPFKIGKLNSKLALLMPINSNHNLKMFLWKDWLSSRLIMNLRMATDQLSSK